jgi:hypothetical protein
MTVHAYWKDPELTRSIDEEIALLKQDIRSRESIIRAMAEEAREGMERSFESENQRAREAPSR